MKSIRNSIIEGKFSCLIALKDKCLYTKNRNNVLCVYNKWRSEIYALNGTRMNR